jgi:hypothetical protein
MCEATAGPCWIQGRASDVLLPRLQRQAIRGLSQAIQGFPDQAPRHAAHLGLGNPNEAPVIFGRDTFS